MLRPLLTPLMRPVMGVKPYGVALAILLGVGSFSPVQLFGDATTPGIHLETYDPNTILRRRNLLTWSEDFTNAAWSSVTGVASRVGDTLVEDVSVNTHVIIQPIPATVSALYVGAAITYTLEFHPTSTRNVCLRIAGPSGSIYAVYNPATGAVVTTSPTGANWAFRVAAAAATLTADGWWRATIVAAVSEASGNPSAYIHIANGTALSYPGDGASFIRVRYPQPERGVTASAYQKVTDWNTEFLAAGGDRVTMFQESGCQTAVTKAEDPIGGFISTERGTTRGPELVPVNFQSDTGWTKGLVGAGTPATVAGGVATIYRTDAANYSSLGFSVPASVGKGMEITVSTATGAGLQVRVGSALGNGSAAIIFPSVGQTITFRVNANANPQWITFHPGTDGTTVTVTAVSMKQLPGAIATQPTGSARPVVSARVNAGTVSEQVSNTVPWGASNYTIENNSLATGLPTGEGPAALAKVTALAASSITTYGIAVPWPTFRFTIYIASPSTRTGGLGLLIRNATTLTNLFSSNMNSAGAITSGIWTSTEVKPGIFRVSVDVTSGFTAGDQLLAYWGSTGGSTTGDFWYVGGADVRSLSDAALNIPRYQRVYSATDYDTDNFPHRCKHDGTDDFLSVPLNMSTTDKVTAWVGGLLKVSDAAAQMILEFTTTSVNNGSFYIAANTAPGNYGAASRGTAGVSAPTATLAAPRNDVLTMQADIGADSLTLDVNGVQAAINTADQGTGNYANDTLYIGARAGSSLRSACAWTSLTVRGGALDAGRRGRMNRYAARLAKINL
jgi:hypothetical protein